MSNTGLAEELTPVAAESVMLEVRPVCGRAIFWQQHLCGRTIFVDQESRQFVAMNIAKGEDVFTGYWPEERNIANTGVDWRGDKWAMIMWPLPNDRRERISLILHENFHRVQSDLPFTSGLYQPANHLEGMHARISLRMEMNLLARAVSSTEASERQAYAMRALQRRAERLTSEVVRESERHLILHEGLPSFAGVSIAYGSDAAARIGEGLLIGEKAASFIRSFAYEVGPAWAFLLDSDAPGWRDRVDGTLDLADLYMVMVLEKTAVVAKTADALLTAIEKEERMRAIESRKAFKQYEERFVKQPQLVLPQSPFSFDPNRAFALGEYGTIYQTFSMRGDWGAFETKAGALVSPDYSRVSVEALPVGDRLVMHHEFWRLTLNQGWQVVKDGSNYRIAADPGN